MNAELLRTAGIIFFAVLLASIMGGLIFLAFAFKRLRNLDVPENATFSETLLYTPLELVIALDLMDLGLDLLAAPLTWLVLDHFGLKALRGFATVEALIPGTQLVPTLTLCWIGVRLAGASRSR